MNDPQTIIGALSAAASWLAVGVMVAQHVANRRTPPPAVPAGPAVRKQRPRRRKPRPVGAARLAAPMGGPTL
jgi:hypothetical protein